VDRWTDAIIYTMTVDDVIVSPVINNENYAVTNTSLTVRGSWCFGQRYGRIRDKSDRHSSDRAGSRFIDPEH